MFSGETTMTRIILTFAAALAMTTPALAAPLGPLVTPDQLQGAEDAVVLDIRGADYAAGHIEDARDAPYALFRGPAENPGAVIPEDDLEQVLEQLGLAPDQPVVITAQGATDTDFGAAARVYWTLKSAGFTDLSILNGGMQAWVNAGLPLSQEAVDIRPTELDITWNDTWTADSAEIADVVAGNRQAALLDARPAEFFEGETAHEAAARPGTLPGAQNLQYTEFFQPGATAISTPGDVRALLAKYGVEEDEEVVSFCNTGHWAATNWFALSELGGVPNVTLYPGSMVEYSATDGPMQNQPGLLQNLLGQFAK